MQGVAKGRFSINEGEVYFRLCADYGNDGSNDGMKISHLSWAGMAFLFIGILTWCKVGGTQKVGGGSLNFSLLRFKIFQNDLISRGK